METVQVRLDDFHRLFKAAASATGRMVILNRYRAIITPSTAALSTGMTRTHGFLHHYLNSGVFQLMIETAATLPDDSDDRVEAVSIETVLDQSH